MGVKIHSTLGSVSLESQNVTGAQTLYIPSISGSKTLLTTDGDGSSLTGVQPFPSGTVMVFYQASAPTAWTKSTSHNNKALRVVSGSGGGSGGSWALSSGATSSSTGAHTHSTPSHSHSHSLSAGAHTLSTAEMPSHNHGIQTKGYGGSTNFRTENNYAGISTYYTSNTGSSGSHSHSLSGSITSGGSGTSGSAGAHTHTISAPQYIDVIVCTKD